MCVCVDGMARFDGVLQSEANSNGVLQSMANSNEAG